MIPAFCAGAATVLAIELASRRDWVLAAFAAFLVAWNIVLEMSL